MQGAPPQHIQRRLELTLGQWRQWQCDPPLAARPALVRDLGKGISNHSTLVGNGHQFVIRIDGVAAASIGLYRQAEWRVLQEASASDIAPTPRYFNPELGSLVTDYLPPDSHQPEDMSALAKLLQRIHNLPAGHQRLKLGEQLQRYEKLLAQRADKTCGKLARFRPQVLYSLDQVENRQSASVLCHNDLLRANRLYSGGILKALDWEYCAMASPWYELAVICCGDELDDARSQALINNYLERPARPEESIRLLQYSVIYRYLELLWYCALDKIPDGEFLAQRISRLTDACARVSDQL